MVDFLRGFCCDGWESIIDKEMVEKVDHFSTCYCVGVLFWLLKKMLNHMHSQSYARCARVNYKESGQVAKGYAKTLVCSTTKSSFLTSTRSTALSVEEFPCFLLLLEFPVSKDNERILSSSLENTLYKPWSNSLD